MDAAGTVTVSQAPAISAGLVPLVAASRDGRWRGCSADRPSCRRPAAGDVDGHVGRGARGTRRGLERLGVQAGFESGLDCTVESPISVCGAAAAATVNDCVAGVASVFSAASVARTAMPCMPSVRAFVVHGLVHAAQAPESSWHWNVEPLSLEANVKVGVLSVVVPVGPDVIVVFGAVVSPAGACCRRRRR